MEVFDIVLLTAAFALVASLYSSVGHAGASGYLAAMALIGVAPAVMKPSALALNVLVATISTVKFCRAGCFSAQLFWPFAITSVPLAFVGGMLTLPGDVYKRVVGAVLLFAAVRLFASSAAQASQRATAARCRPARMCSHRPLVGPHRGRRRYLLEPAAAARRLGRDA